MSFVLHLSPVRLATVLLLLAVACVAVAGPHWIEKENARGIRTSGSDLATKEGTNASSYTNSRAAAPAPGCDDVWTATSVTNTPP